MQVGSRTPHSAVMVQLVAEALYEGAYETLRTQEQLCYVVDVYALEVGNVVGLGIVAETPHSPEAVAIRMDAFINTWARQTLPRLKGREFSVIRESVTGVKVRSN
jgi:secreted Zn-dependent insulinase-like peptidase